jgi:hypothetical protein
VNNFSIKSEKDIPQSDCACISGPQSRQIIRFIGTSPRDQHTVMAGLIWGAVTSEVAHRAAFEFKRFLDTCPPGTQFVLSRQGNSLTVTPSADTATLPKAIQFTLDDFGLVL